MAVLWELAQMPTRKRPKWRPEVMTSTGEFETGRLDVAQTQGRVSLSPFASSLQEPLLGT